MDEKNEQVNVREDYRSNKKKVSNWLINFGTLPLKSIGTQIVNYSILIILGVGIIAAGIPLFGALFQRASPWSQQRQEIASKNNIRDAYSAIIGSDVGLVSQNGFIKWFSSKEAKQVDIFIPKLINYSGLFDDDSRREELKDTFEESINSDLMKESTVYYQIFYDGSTLGKWKNGEKVDSYKDLKNADKNAIMKDLRLKLRTDKEIEFMSWQKKNNLESVNFEFEPNSNTVEIKGVFESDGMLWSSPEYKISAKYQYNTGSWQLENSSLKVDKVK